MIERFVCHSKKVWTIALEYGWQPGARYTNLRDIRDVESLGFLDIDWKNYNFQNHLAATKKTQPKYTVAQDIEDICQLDEIINQANSLAEYADTVIVVPKDTRLADGLCDLIPTEFLIGYSVPTRYGGTQIPIKAFNGRAVHLLGGRPDHQRQLADELSVNSIDTNRFTLDASYGDFFDGDKFRPHPKGGYRRCLEASLKNMNSLWENYQSSKS